IPCGGRRSLDWRAVPAPAAAVRRPGTYAAARAGPAQSGWAGLYFPGWLSEGRLLVQAGQRVLPALRAAVSGYRPSTAPTTCRLPWGRHGEPVPSRRLAAARWDCAG